MCYAPLVWKLSLLPIFVCINIISQIKALFDELQSIDELMMINHSENKIAKPTSLW